MTDLQSAQIGPAKAAVVLEASGGQGLLTNMPLVIVHSLAPENPQAFQEILADVRDSGARALNCSTSNVWVMFQAVPPGLYVQGETAAHVPQQKSHPPVVIAKLQAGRSRAELSAFAAAITGAIARGLSIPAENVWLQYEEMRSEDVWFGGRWTRE